MVVGLMVRKAVAGDRQAILKVTLGAYQEYAAVMQPRYWRLYRENITMTLADIGSAEQFVAESGGQVVGSVLLYPAGAVLGSPGSSRPGLRWPEIRLLAVAPESRGQGIGEALVEACIEHARSEGAGAVTLHTNDMMEAASRLYKRMGFTRKPELDFSPRPGVVIKGYRFQMD